MMSVEADTQSFSEIIQVPTTLVLLFGKKKKSYHPVELIYGDSGWPLNNT
jgi:hypothetical protein